MINAIEINNLYKTYTPKKRSQIDAIKGTN